MSRRTAASTALILAVLATPPGCATREPALPPHRVQQARLMQTLAALPTKRAARGDIAHQEGLAATETLIVRELRGMGYQPRLQPLTWNLNKQAEFEATVGSAVPRTAPETTDALASRTWNNIILDLPGTDLPSEVLIVGAHFDAVPGSPGADDNGSGTAALLEIARAFRERPTRRTVRLIVFNLEEVGLKGSAEYVRLYKPTLASGKEKLVGMVSLEMLGYFTDEPGSQRSPIP